MGSCVSSVQKENASDMKLRLPFGSKTKLVSPSPVEEKFIANGELTNGAVGLKSQMAPSDFRDFVCKEESFFDSQPWLDSDCEDDFFSVNGDFTPSRGSTPVQQIQSSMGACKVRDIVEGITPGFNAGLSPTDNKKKLADLLKENLQNEQDVEEQNTPSKQDGTDGKIVSLDLPTKSVNGAMYVSGANSVGSSERTPNIDVEFDGKSGSSAQCCLPRLLSTCSFSERKRKTSPTQSIW